MPPMFVSFYAWKFESLIFHCIFKRTLYRNLSSRLTLKRAFFCLTVAHYFSAHPEALYLEHFTCHIYTFFKGAQNYLQGAFLASYYIILSITTKLTEVTSHSITLCCNRHFISPILKVYYENYVVSFLMLINYTVFSM